MGDLKTNHVNLWKFITEVEELWLLGSDTGSEGF